LPLREILIFLKTALQKNNLLARFESVWALLKRGYHGVFHHFSDKHIGRYVDEFVFRLNDTALQKNNLLAR
jgi:DUF2075 family protein